VFPSPSPGQAAARDTQSINQSNTRSATRAQENPHPSAITTRAGNPATRSVAGLGGLRTSRASVSLRDSLFYVLHAFYREARKKLPRKTTSGVYHLHKEEERDTRARDLAYYVIHYPSRENRCVPYAQGRLLCPGTHTHTQAAAAMPVPKHIVEAGRASPRASLRSECPQNTS